MNEKLLGFEGVEKSLLENFHNKQLHHGLLFTGTKGIGKKIFAHQLATKILLSSSQNPNGDLQKIKLNSHPDLLIIQKEDKKRNITVDAVRQINQFLSLTGAICENRIIIIDAIDDLNRSSSNAILKTLEEPSKDIFLFLINHNQSKVLDTIKSRCRLIKIPNPSNIEFENILKEKISEISQDEIEILAKISDHSIGSALKMHECNAIDLYEKIKELIWEGSIKDILSLSKAISADEDLWDVFEKLITFYLYSLVFQLEERGQRNDKIFTTFDKIGSLFLATKNLNLDKSQSIVNIFTTLKAQGL